MYPFISPVALYASCVHTHYLILWSRTLIISKILNCFMLTQGSKQGTLRTKNISYRPSPKGFCSVKLHPPKAWWWVSSSWNSKVFTFSFNTKFRPCPFSLFPFTYFLLRIVPKRYFQKHVSTSARLSRNLQLSQLPPFGNHINKISYFSLVTIKSERPHVKADSKIY